MPLGGEKIGDAYVRIFADGSQIPEGVEKGLDSADGEFDEAGERHGKAYSKKFGEEFDDGFVTAITSTFEKQLRDRSPLRQKVGRLGSRSGDDFMRGFGDRLRSSLDRFDLDLSDHFRDDLNRFERDVGRSGQRTGRNWVGGFNRGLDLISDDLGAITGRGSRNNFLNFIGSVVRNVSRLIFLVPKLVFAIGNTMTKAFKDAGGGLSGLVASFAALGPLLGTAAIGAAAVVAAVAALVVVIGPLVAALSLLLGIVTALAGSLGFALVGAIASLAAVLGPAVAGIGVLAIGIAGLSDSMKKQLKEDIEPLREGWQALSEDAAKALTQDIGQNAKDLVPVLDALRAPVRNIAEALSDIGSDWVDRLDSSGFNRFLTRIDKFLPGALRRLGDIAAQTLGGLGGLFTGMIPFMRNVLEYLDDITERFSDWTNSRSGQQAIKDFFSDVEESTEAVSGWLDSIWDFVKLLFTQGRETGDDIFSKMERSIRNATEFLEENPDALDEWFRDAEDFAEALGEALTTIKEIIDYLDNETSRDAITGIFNLAGLELKILGFFGRGGLIGKLVREFDNINWKDLFTPDGGFAQFGPMLTKPFTGLNDKIAKALGKIDLLRQFDFPSLGTIAGKFIGGNTRILNAVGTIELLKKFNFPSLGTIAGRFIGGAERILNAIGTVFLWNVFDFPSIGDIASKFSGLASAILNAIGRIDIGSLIDIPSPGGGVPYVPGVATGGMFNFGPALRWIGEDGPEAVVPLDRPLSQVDPAVRELSAIAQGLRHIPGMASGGVVSRGVDVGGITVITPTKDPHAVALETVNEIVAKVG